MNFTYKKNKLEKQMSNASEMKKAFGVRAKRVSQRKDEIIASPNLKVLMQLPKANCHPLTGDRKGDWGLDISGNFRIIFEIVDDPIPETSDGGINTELVTNIRILEVEDYH